MKRLDLNGEWRYQRVGGSEAGPAIVPGDIYRDLLDNDQIPDPFYRDNELQLQWIGESDWAFSREFEVAGDLLESDRVLLHCKGLDALATITINGEEVGTADNMFRTWEFDVRDVLKAGTNAIAIHFKSADRYIKECGQELKLPGCTTNMGYIRKEQCNFGWDWGIKAVTCGIWRDIELLGIDRARLSDVKITQEHSPGRVDLAVEVDAENTAGGELEALVKVSLNGSIVATVSRRLSASEPALATTGSGSVAATAALSIENPRLWWPNNLGEQHLYEVNIALLAEDGEQVDECSKRIGLRTLKLDRHQDEWGESFQFVVNGQPFFAKGANWIPADGILARMTPERYRELVAAAGDVNMNMLRVWGGGIYEDDSFYDLCDELGICIWQDFMFACGHYPVFDEAFMGNVRAEAVDNVRRLRHHPCMALWCGNNELEQMNVAKAEQMGGWEGYGKLFDKLLAEVVAEQDPQRDYWPSSPHSPCGDRNDHNNPTCGDAHLWEVWHGKKPFEWYRTCEHRFNSEFGFQSFPEPRTVYGYTEERDRNVTSWVMEHHQRSWIGNTAIMQYMLDWFLLPLGFDNTLWLSQILQGMAMKYACEHWRRSMPRGMGTLYWQLNDTWPVASWSSIDYHGRWKALHYMARDFYAPVLISGLEDLHTKTVEIHVTSDLLQARDLTAVWRVTDVSGQPLREGHQDLTAPPSANTHVTTLDLKKEVGEHGFRDILIWLDLYTAGSDTSARPISSNLVLMSRPKHLELEQPEISAATKPSGRGFTVTLDCKYPALWTWIELEDTDATYSRNFIHLAPGRPAEIEVRPKPLLAQEDFAARLKIKSLVDTF